MRRVVALLTIVIWGCAAPDLEREWSTVRQDLDGALLSVWVDDDGALAVGADDELGPWILEQTGPGRWDRTMVGGSGDLWWVTRDPTGAVWLVGEKGLVLTREPAAAEFRAVDVPTDKTLYGVWFAPNGTGWMVGGDFLEDADSGHRGVVLTGAGERWSTDGTISQAVVGSTLLFKVWGTAEDDVWIVGEGGTVLHRRSGDWRVEDTPVDSRLVTVHGRAEGPVHVVGGGNAATLLSWDEAGFRNESAALGEFTPALNGVHVGSDGVFVVGNRGLVARGDGQDWSVVEPAPTQRDLHAVWVRDGEVWAVGGNLMSPALDGGVLLHYGRKRP